MNVRVRPATVSDAEAIAGVHVASWRDAYVGLVPQDFLDGLDPTRRADGWQRILTSAEPPRSGAFVADDGRRVVGFAHSCPSRDQGASPGTGELTAIYALSSAWGAGVGRALMSACVQSMSSAGFAIATLWVLDGNTRARHFYEAAGWTHDGEERTEQFPGLAVREVRYQRALR